MVRNLLVFVFCFSMLPIYSTSVSAQRRARPERSRGMENLTRGVVAVKQTGSVYISWRLFGTDPETISFDLYRITGSSEPVKAN
jgi:hypothetical protein